MNFKYPSIACLTLVFIVLSGCSSKKEIPKIATQEIGFYSTEKVNEGYALAIDIIFIYNPSITRSIEGLTARKWFKKKAQLLRDYPNSLSVKSIQLVPGQLLSRVKVKEKQESAIASFVFANYYADGIHRSRIDQIKVPVIKLLEKKFTVGRRTKRSNSWFSLF